MKTLNALARKANGRIDAGYKASLKAEDHYIAAVAQLEDEGRKLCRKKGINFAAWCRKNVNLMLLPASMR